MAYPISDVTRRVVYTGSAGTGPYSFTFEVLANTDIQVYKNTTLLTLTTNYTVTINSNGTGSVTLVSAATSSDTITIVGDRAIQRATDFVTGGDLFANTLNDEFDSLVIFAQQVDEKADRGLKAPVTDPTDVNMVLPVKASRKGKVLAFDSTTGDPVAGPALDAVTTVIAQSANINTVAANITSVNTVAGNNTNVTTVAGVSSAVTTVAGISSNVTSVAGNSSNINTVAGNNANITTVAGISGNVTTVAGISANVTSVAGNSTNINAVAGNATNINAVNANKTNIDAVAGVSSNVTTVASNISSVNTAATNIAAIIDAPNQATAAAASAVAAAASAASGMYSAVQDKSANYTVVAGDAGDLIRVTTTSGAITITLPTISTVGDGFKVAIVKWTSDGNAVSVVRSSTNTINGATSYSLGNQYSSATFVADLETGQWFAVASGLGVSNVAVDVFSGNGSTTAFTLSGDPGSKNNTMVEVSGVYQQKSTYTVSGTTLTFSTAPPTGTNNIEIVWTAPLAIGTPSDGTVTTAKLGAITNINSGASALGLQTNGTTAVTISTAQNVGIGTTSPDRRLSVQTPTAGASLGSNAVVFSDFANATMELKQSTTENQWYSNSAMTFGVNGSERMRITSGGVVGINTSSPNTGGNLTIKQGSSTYQLQLEQSNTTDNYSLRCDSANGDLTFSRYQSSAYTERMRLTLDGNLRIGTNTDNDTRIAVYWTQTGPSWGTKYLANNSGSTNFIEFRVNMGSSPTTVGSITYNGTNTLYNTTSDVRLKKNIVDAPSSFSLINQIKIRSFDWKDSDAHVNYGVIAQEVFEVEPSCVSEGDTGNEIERTWGVDTSILVPAMIKAIQELKALVDAQATEIAELKAKVN